MRIDCPFCGPRELHEYHFLRVLGPPDADPVTEVYGRDNVPDRSLEYWQHRHGCRAWLVLERNPSTAQVLSVRMLGSDAP
jgi:methylglutamate dehydrogenase subunit B